MDTSIDVRKCIHGMYMDISMGAPIEIPTGVTMDTSEDTSIHISMDISMNIY